MSTPLTTLVNNSTLLGVRDISLSLTTLKSFDDSASSDQSSRTNALGIIEKQVCLALARGRTDISLNGTNNVVVAGVSDTSFGQHVLVNNVAIDTPNVAMMTYLTDASFIAYKFDSIIGIDASSSRVTAPIYDFSCVVFQKETLVLDFSRNMAPDVCGNWTVQFSESLQPNLSRALNSELTARRNNNPFYPISVTEPSFNKITALCSANNDAFNYYYTTPNGTIPTPVRFDYSNNVIKFPSNKQTAGTTPLFTINSKQNLSSSLFANETGTFRFVQLEPSGGIVTTSIANGVPAATSSLPFLIEDPNANVTNLDYPMTTTKLNQIFNNINSDNSFTFSLDTSANSGGYTFTNSNNFFILDSTNLTNNANYMKNYVNDSHSLKINDGYLRLDNGNNSYGTTRQFFQSALVPRGEILNVHNYNTDGLITLKVQAINNRYKNYDSSNISTGFYDGTIENIVVSYDASDNEYLSSQNMVTSDILNSLSSISNNAKRYDTSEEFYDFTAIKIYDGFRYSSYNYINARDLTPNTSFQYQSGRTAIYSTHYFNPEEFAYNVQNPSGELMFIQLLSSQSLVSDTDVSGLYFLNREQNGNIPTAKYTYTGQLKSAKDVSGFQYGDNIKGEVNITNFQLSDLSYVSYRLLLVPKTIEELRNEVTITDASLVYGTLNEYNDFVVDASATYLTLTDENMKKPIKSNVGNEDSKDTGVNLFDLKDALNGDNNLNREILDTSYNFTVTFDTTTNKVKFISDNSGQFLTDYYNFELFATPVILDAHINLNSPLFKYAVQLPFGHYTNVYFETGYKYKRDFDNFSCTLTIKARSILGLKAYLQGSGVDLELPANPFDISYGWTNINTEPILVESNNTFYDIRTSGFIPYNDRVTQISTNGTINIKLLTKSVDVDKIFSQPLYQPGYVIPLQDSPNQNISSQFFGRYVDSNHLVDVPFSFDFNPAKVVRRTTNLDGLLDLSLNVNTTIQNNQRNYRITSNALPSLDISLSFPKFTPANINFWYCPKDIWSVATQRGESEYKQANSINTQIKLTDGIVLTDISSSKPGDVVSFDLTGQEISIRLSTYESFSNYGPNNRYDDANSTQELTQDISNLGSDSGDQLTQYFNLNNQYRGYHSNNPGIEDTQTYVIHRTPAQYSFFLNDNSNSNVAFADMYKDLSNTSIQFKDYKNAGTAFDFGLKSTFLKSSINGTNSTLNYPITVTGDNVIVTRKVDNSTTTINTNLKTYVLDTSNNYSFVSGRVTAGTNNSVWSNQTLYKLEKAEQQVQIYNYNDKYYDNPLNQNWLSSPSSTQFVSNRDLALGINLTKSITLTLASGYYFGTDTSGTFLISTPPVLTFTAFGINAAKGKYLVDGSLNRLATFDVSGLSTNTWTMSMPSVTTLTFNPYATRNDISINNITFQLQSFNASLGNYFDNKTLPLTTNIPVKGNFVKRGRYDNNNTLLTTVSGYTLSPFAIQNLTTPDANAGYTLQYKPPFNGVNGTVNYYIGSAFCDGSFSFVIDPAVGSNTAVYGILPYVDVLRQRKYQLQAYKIVDTRNSNIGTSFQTNSTSPNVYIHHGVERYTRFIQIPDVSFSATPFNLSTQRSAIQLSDISGWVLDTSFVEQDLNFNLSAYSTIGNTKIANQFLVYADKNMVNLKYMNMPDIFKVVDGDGSSLFRIAYNGTVASDIVSTTQLILNPGTGTEQAPGTFDEPSQVASTAINSQFSYYETDTFDILL